MLCAYDSYIMSSIFRTIFGRFYTEENKSISAFPLSPDKGGKLTTVTIQLPDKSERYVQYMLKISENKPAQAPPVAKKDAATATNKATTTTTPKQKGLPLIASFKIRWTSDKPPEQQEPTNTDDTQPLPTIVWFFDNVVEVETQLYDLFFPLREGARFEPENHHFPLFMFNEGKFCNVHIVLTGQQLKDGISLPQYAQIVYDKLVHIKVPDKATWVGYRNGCTYLLHVLEKYAKRDHHEVTLINPRISPASYTISQLQDFTLLERSGLNLDTSIIERIVQNAIIKFAHIDCVSTDDTTYDLSKEVFSLFQSVATQSNPPRTNISFHRLRAFETIMPSVSRLKLTEAPPQGAFRISYHWLMAAFFIVCFISAAILHTVIFTGESEPPPRKPLRRRRHERADRRRR